MSEKVEQRLAEIADESAREALFTERLAAWERWLDTAIEQEITGGGNPYPTNEDFLPSILAELQGNIDQEQAAIEARWRAEHGTLRRQLIEREIAHTTERRQRIEQASALRRRIGALEEQLASERQAREEFAKALASMAEEIARDRALHRMRDARRLLPHAQRADLERVRRKTDRAIEDRLSEGGFDA